MEISELQQQQATGWVDIIIKKGSSVQPPPNK
jgi:hypothetical protein